MPINAIRQFFRLESASGILLIITTILAIACNNSSLSAWYDDFLTIHFAVAVGSFALSKPLLLWINDGLMAVFFLLVGLELKRECLEGQLQGVGQIALPLIAAVAGIVLPALIYLGVTQNHEQAMAGWAIPTATDIAFALGVLSLFGSRISLSLKLFLMTLAIIDDIGAILIIAFFHSHDLSYAAFGAAAVLCVLLFSMNSLGVRNLAVYIVLGVLLWVSVLKSGVHATLAGVVLGFAIPLGQKDDELQSPLVRLETGLHPWVAFIIMPVFAFANAGLSFAGMTLATLLSPVVMGIVWALFIGKQIGVFGAVWLAVKLGIARLPAGSSWMEMYGVSLLCGIGFTMSLFIGSLTFKDLEHFHIQVRLGVLIASILSGVLGLIVLKVAVRRRELQCGV
jgi:NhaA family Na+:H+ antiporter